MRRRNGNAPNDGKAPNKMNRLHAPCRYGAIFATCLLWGTGVTRSVGQYDNRDSYAPADADAYISPGGQPVRLQPDQPFYGGNVKYVFHADGTKEMFDPVTAKFVPIQSLPLVTAGTKVKLADGAVLTAVDPATQFSVSFYPIADFSVGGEVQTAPNTFVGGTDAIPGFIVDLALTTSNKLNESLTYGAWYYRQYPKQLATSTSGLYNGNLFDLHLTYMQHGVGGEIGYLDDVDHKSASAIAFLLLDITGKLTNGVGANPWSVRVGVGAYNNFTQGVTYPVNPVAPSLSNRNSLGPTASFQLSYRLGPHYSLIFSDWWVRNRNEDLTRLALGIGVKF